MAAPGAPQRWSRGWNRRHARSTVPGFTCTPPGGRGTVCDPLTRGAAMFEGVVGDRITFTLGDKLALLYGVLKHVEIDAARRRARVCDFFFTDAITWRCHAMPVLCYTAGTLTLPKIPESGAELATMPYRLDVTGDALRLQAAF